MVPTVKPTPTYQPAPLPCDAARAAAWERFWDALVAAAAKRLAEEQREEAVSMPNVA